MFASAGAASSQTPRGNVIPPTAVGIAILWQNAIVKMENTLNFTGSTDLDSLSLHLLASKDIISGLNDSPSWQDNSITSMIFVRW